MSYDRQHNNLVLLNVYDLVLQQTKDTAGSRNIEQQSLIPSTDPEKFPSILSEGDFADSTGQLEIPTLKTGLESIRARVRIESCERHCHCQCHVRTQTASPQWLDRVLGTIFWTYTGTSNFLRRPCDLGQCIGRQSSAQHLTYHFPPWMVRKAFMMTTSYGGLSGISGSWSLGFPRAISASHKVWQHIERHESGDLARLLRTRVVLGNDLADDDGTPLLIVS